MKNDASVLREYFTDDKNVKKSVDKFILMKISELRKLDPPNKNRVRLFADEAIGVEELDRENSESMTYLELMCILWHSKYSPAYKFKYPHSEVCMDSYENYLFYADMITQFLYEACDRSVEIRKFMTIPAKRLCDVFRAKGLWLKIRAEYKKLKKINDCAFDGKDITVKDVLDACREITCRAWHPACMLPSEYFSNIKRAHALEADLLIGSFFYEYPDLTRVKECYGSADNEYDEPEEATEIVVDPVEGKNK